MQSLPVTGLIMVTTPQKLAALIVNKAVHMAQQIGVSIVGVIENMAYYRCPDTGKNTTSSVNPMEGLSLTWQTLLYWRKSQLTRQ